MVFKRIGLFDSVNFNALFIFIMSIKCNIFLRNLMVIHLFTPLFICLFYLYVTFCDFEFLTKYFRI